MENKRNQSSSELGGAELANMLFNAFFGNSENKSVVTDLNEIKEVLSKKEYKVKSEEGSPEDSQEVSANINKKIVNGIKQMLKSMDTPFSNEPPKAPANSKELTIREKFYAKQREAFQKEKEASDKVYEKYLYDLVVELMESGEVTPLTKDPTEVGSGIGIYVMERPQLGNLLNVCRELKANQDWSKVEYLYADEGVYLKFYF